MRKRRSWRERKGTEGGRMKKKNIIRTGRTRLGRKSPEKHEKEETGKEKCGVRNKTNREDGDERREGEKKKPWGWSSKKNERTDRSRDLGHKTVGDKGPSESEKNRVTRKP
jgi:hypothetical protein